LTRAGPGVRDWFLPAFIFAIVMLTDALIALTAWIQAISTIRRLTGDKSAKRTVFFASG
jgi:hypothetical protein